MSDVDLKGRRILYVGGRNRTPHVRRLIEERNGRFEYHDGGMEESIDRLGTLLRKADAVLFPVNFVSHSALNKVKSLCRSLDKPYFPLRHSGLDSIVSALSTIAH
ncbi:MAG: DUF2325 domain-containing protein [Bacteroidota bacterium]